MSNRTRFLLLAAALLGGATVVTAQMIPWGFKMVDHDQAGVAAAVFVIVGAGVLMLLAGGVEAVRVAFRRRPR